VVPTICWCQLGRSKNSSAPRPRCSRGDHRCHPDRRGDLFHGGRYEHRFTSDRRELPSVLQLIPASYPNQLRVAKDTLLTSLKRAKLLAKDSTSSVRLTMKDHSVEIRTQSHDAGDVEDNVDADYGGEEMTIAFNPSFLIDGIEAVPGDEVVLEMSDSVRPRWCTALRTRDSATFSCRWRSVVTVERRGPPRVASTELPALRRADLSTRHRGHHRSPVAQRTGKTTVLEAVYTLATATSFRTGAASDLIRTGESASEVHGVLYQRERRVQVDLTLTRGTRNTTKRMLVNGQRPKSRADVADVLPLTIFTPEGVDIVRQAREPTGVLDEPPHRR